MKVQNVSARLHHIGTVSIGPGEIKEVPKGFENAINKADLIEIKAASAQSKPSASKTSATVDTE